MASATDVVPISWELAEAEEEVARAAKRLVRVISRMDEWATPGDMNVIARLAHTCERLSFVVDDLTWIDRRVAPSEPDSIRVAASHE